MHVKDIAGFRSDLLRREYEQTDQWDEHFLGYSCGRQFGFFKLMHGKKSDIRGFLTKEVQMAEDGQAIYEFIQNAADCDATHCWLFFDDEQFLVLNNGAPFTAAGIGSILNVGQSEGKLTPGKIGRFGIGFKLVHRLVGEDSGLDEMLTDYAGPLLFSWSRPEQFQQFRQGEAVEAVPYDAATAAAGTGGPWLTQPPFQLTDDRLGNAAPTTAATLTAPQLRELLRLASADQADLTQHLTIQAVGDAYLLTPRRAGGFMPYFTTHELLITYVGAELPQLHLLPADKLLADLQRQVLHGSQLYDTLVQLTPPARLREPELVSVLTAAGYSSVQRRYLERLPELSFILEDGAYPPSHPDRQLLELAANPQVLEPAGCPAFRRRLSLTVPGAPTFLIEGAAVNDNIELPLETDRTMNLSRTKLLPGSDQRSAYVNQWANRLAANADLRDLLGLGTLAD